MVNGMTKEMELEKKEEEGLNWATMDLCSFLIGIGSSHRLSLRW